MTKAKRYICRRCGKTYAYRKSLTTHIKAHEREERMAIRKARGMTCGNCSKYYKDLKRCSIWGARYTTTPTPIWEPDAPCSLAFCLFKKGEPKNFHSARNGIQNITL